MSIVCPQCNTPVPATALRNTQATCAECGYVFSVAKSRQSSRRKASHRRFFSTTPYIHTRTAGDTLILTRTRVSSNVIAILIGGVIVYFVGVLFLSRISFGSMMFFPMMVVAALAGLAGFLYLGVTLGSMIGSTTMRVNASTITVQHNFLPERDLTFPSALATHIEVEENNHDLFDIVARLSSGKYALLLKNLPDAKQAETIRQQIENHLDLLDTRHLEDNPADLIHKPIFQFGKGEKQKQITKGQDS